MDDTRPAPDVAGAMSLLARCLGWPAPDASPAVADAWTALCSAIGHELVRAAEGLAADRRGAWRQDEGGMEQVRRLTEGQTLQVIARALRFPEGRAPRPMAVAGTVAGRLRPPPVLEDGDAVIRRAAGGMICCEIQGEEAAWTVFGVADDMDDARAEAVAVRDLVRHLWPHLCGRRGPLLLDVPPADASARP